MLDFAFIIMLRTRWGVLVSRQYYMRVRFYNSVYYIDPSEHYVCASGVERRTEDVRRRTATGDEYKSLSSHLREKLRNGKPLTPSEKAAAENLGINVNRKRSKSGSKSNSDVVVEVELSRS